MTTVDARGLLCPLPVTMARRKMEALRAGEDLLVLATDPEAPIDLAAWAVDHGHGFSERRAAGWMELVLRKGGHQTSVTP